ncbi:MAG: ABC transporter permease [Prosthecobacter sp.]|nr:ABC transporter permease [Prosthecobacter sp.]
MIAAALHLARCYVARHRAQSLLLAGAFALVTALPLCLRVLGQAVETVMRARALSTPLVLGSRGSALDLMLKALYFKQQPLPSLPTRYLAEVRSTGLAAAIPIDARFHAQGAPIIGTEIEYFSFRHLRLAEGRMMTRLGDCVVGARLAQKRSLHPGSALFSSQEQVFDFAGVYPLKMRITGVLAPTGSADDEAVFVDLKTSRLISGAAHGHDDVAAQPESVLKQENGHTIANASVRMYQEVTDENLSSFHFHGDENEQPLSAILILPQDAKSEALLAGRYLKESLPVHLICPSEVFESLMSTLFQVERLLFLVLGITLAAALAVSALVFTLSFRLRGREFQTLSDLGISPAALRLTKALEIALVSGAGLLMAGGLTALAQLNAEAWVKWLLA